MVIIYYVPVFVVYFDENVRVNYNFFTPYIDVHLNIWREIMEFITDLTNWRSLHAFKTKRCTSYNFIVFDLGQSLYTFARKNVCIAYVVLIAGPTYI